MRLPNAEQAVVPDAKLVEYLLSVRHPYGRSKARFFASLGYWAGHPEPLRSALITLAVHTDMEEIPFAFGTKYVGSADLVGPSGRHARLTTVWTLEGNDPRPRFVTAYPA